MKKIFFLLAVVLFSWACAKETKKPAHVLSKETMVKLMADMAMAEAKVKSLRIPSDSARTIYQEYEKAIFLQRDVTAREYKESYQFYLMNYNEMTAIQSAVIDTLDRRHKNAVRN